MGLYNNPDGFYNLNHPKYAGLLETIRKERQKKLENLERYCIECGYHFIHIPIFVPHLDGVMQVKYGLN